MWHVSDVMYPLSGRVVILEMEDFPCHKETEILWKLPNIKSSASWSPESEEEEI